MCEEGHLQVSPILKKLRDETRTLHVELENSINLLKPQAQFEDYIRFLIKMYGFVVPIEQKLIKYEPVFQKYNINLSNRSRQQKLYEDLVELGVNNISELRISSNLPIVSNFDRAWGVLYVLEGSTLGSQILLKSLTQIEKLQNKHGFRYLQLYGDEVGGQWVSFCKSIDNYCRNKSVNQSEIIAAAQDTFRYLKQWFETTEI